MRHCFVLLCLLGSLSAFAAPTAEKAPESLNWLPWSDDIFAKAAKSKKLVLLDLEAVWCHWCHVMDETTYTDPKVVAYLKAHYLTVRVDQDSRPDLANRYEEYGWPATIFFDAKGKELVLDSGYQEPAEFLEQLKHTVRNPKPVKPSTKVHFAASANLAPDTQKKLQTQWTALYDEQHGGWSTGGNRYLDWDSVEFSLLEAQGGNQLLSHRAKQTLDANLKLIDPVWGGVYQYSVGGDWNEPHFEKIMSMQAEVMRIYAIAYGQTHDAKYLKAAQDIEKFLEAFLLSSDGAFYTSQDADLVPGEHSDKYFALDDAARRKQGIPHVDEHRYARENGWAIRGLLALYQVTLEDKYLKLARRSADWIIANRSIPGGGFRHDEKDAAGPYLGDSLAMGRAFLALYRATAERDWLKRAEETTGYIASHFVNHDGKKTIPGYVTVISSSPLTSKPHRDENLALARFANLLSHYSGNKMYREIAESAMKYASAPELADEFPQAAVLLADRELSSAPLHITVVGPKDDASSKELYAAGLKYPVVYKRIEWWDNREGRLPNPDVNYPQLSKPSAFLCTASRCSAPIQKADELAMKVTRLVNGS